MEESFDYVIQKEEINCLPLGSFQGKIEIPATLEEAEKALEALLVCDCIGFDSESRPSFKKGEKHPIALIQLSSNDNAFLIRISRIGVPENLKKILSSEKIMKIGLGIRNEINELEKFIDVKCQNFCDLEKIAQKHRFKQRGVRALAAYFLKIRISKKAQKTNWERAELSESQINYAATDAWICLRIYQEMIANKFVELS